MLIHLYISNFALVEKLELDFQNGLTVLTGETGAGKSILLDALGLALGDKASPAAIRAPFDEAEIAATFEISKLTSVQDWLTRHELNAEGDCLLRRLVNKDGRSRAYINGRPVPLTQIRELASLLLGIQGQHQHQVLLQTEYQRRLLDAYADHLPLTAKVKELYLEWQKMDERYKALQQEEAESDKLALLSYQLQELEELALREGELEDIDTEHKRQAHAEQWLTVTQQILSRLQDDAEMNILSNLNLVIRETEQLKIAAPTIPVILELLTSANINLNEATSELQVFQQSIEADPQRLAYLESRINSIHQLARKHRVQPSELIARQHLLKTQKDTLGRQEILLKELEQELIKLKSQYKISALALSQSRQAAAALLSAQITERLPTLGMNHGRLVIDCRLKTTDTMSIHGIDDIEFLVSTNPGHALAPLKQVASGGELSRISLAIQVITALKMTIPTLIFDEVDTGVSGKTAAIVGILLKQLGHSTQVLCITHLPQVAAEGQHHFRVVKQQTASSTHTEITLLKGKARVEELARMLGGVEITKQALAHAKALLQEHNKAIV